MYVHVSSAPPMFRRLLTSMFSTDTVDLFVKLSKALTPSAVLFVCYSLWPSDHALPLPPGPHPWPIVGNLRDFPLHPIHACELSAKYGMFVHHLYVLSISYTLTYYCAGLGAVVHLSAFGNHAILLGSHHAAINLLEKRSSNYSDRDMYEYSKL